MFVHIRRHQKWLWVLIAGATIISFVYFLDPTTGRRGGKTNIFGRSSSEFASINGRSVGADEYEQARSEARLEYLFSAGRWPEEDENSRQFFNLDNQTQRRLILLEKLRDLDLRANDEAVADWIARAFRDRKSGAFQMELYQQFVKTALPRGRVSENVFVNFVQHQVGLEQLSSIAGLAGGLVTPREAEATYRQENEELSTEVVL